MLSNNISNPSFKLNSKYDKNNIIESYREIKSKYYTPNTNSSKKEKTQTLKLNLKPDKYNLFDDIKLKESQNINSCIPQSLKNTNIKLSYDQIAEIGNKVQERKTLYENKQSHNGNVGENSTSITPVSSNDRNYPPNNSKFEKSSSLPDIKKKNINFNLQDKGEVPKPKRLQKYMKNRKSINQDLITNPDFSNAIHFKRENDESEKNKQSHQTGSQCNEVSANREMSDDITTKETTFWNSSVSNNLYSDDYEQGCDKIVKNRVNHNNEYKASMHLQRHSNKANYINSRKTITSSKSDNEFSIHSISGDNFFKSKSTNNLKNALDYSSNEEKSRIIDTINGLIEQENPLNNQNNSFDQGVIKSIKSIISEENDALVSTSSNEEEDSNKSVLKSNQISQEYHISSIKKYILNKNINNLQIEKNTSPSKIKRLTDEDLNVSKECTIQEMKKYEMEYEHSLIKVDSSNKIHMNDNQGKESIILYSEPNVVSQQSYQSSQLEQEENDKKKLQFNDNRIDANKHENFLKLKANPNPQDILFEKTFQYDKVERPDVKDYKNSADNDHYSKIQYRNNSEKYLKRKIVGLKDLNTIEPNSNDKNYNWIIKTLKSKKEEGKRFSHQYSALKIDLLFTKN